MEKSMTIEERIDSNFRYQKKLSDKRREAMKICESIKQAIYDNFDILLPENLSAFKAIAERVISNGRNWDMIERYEFLQDNFMETIRTYYRMMSNAKSGIASKFENSDGDVALWVHGYFYSKNRLDPTWNWKKSKLIRKKYRNYLIETQIHKTKHPVHLVLTVPHPEGRYNGKRFYGDEIIKKFNVLRQKPEWKKFVFAGEYGLEVSANHSHKSYTDFMKNGLHIHVHSLVFLNITRVNKFRDWIKVEWEKLTGATQIHCESLYFFKKGENGRYITELVNLNKIEEFEANEGEFERAIQSKGIVRKKFYIDDEINRIKKDETLNDSEKEDKILNCFLFGVMECIKYHFKNECLKDYYGNYDFFLINDILVNTKNKRLYSRFGEFYNCKDLCFNNLTEETGELEPELETNTETASEQEDTKFGKMKNISINPFTMKELKISNTQVVLYDPAKLLYTRAGSGITAWNTDAFYDVGKCDDVRKLMAEIIQDKFKKKNNIEKNHVKPVKKNNNQQGKNKRKSKAEKIAESIALMESFGIDLNDIDIL
jgi:hypothetical protein